MLVNLRAAIALGCIAGFLLSVFGSRALAADNTTTYTPVAEGSTLTHRSEIDSCYGQVYIYVGGSFPTGTHPVTFEFLFDLSTYTTMGYLTPLLFEFQPGEAFTTFTVAGIAKGFQVNLNALPQAIPFDVIAGATMTPNGRYTFGFINALVDSSGTPTATSLGTVDFGYPAESGPGIGGPQSTNNWAASNECSLTPVAALGTTFSLPGANADYVLVVPPYRTYSARAIGAVPAQ